MTKTEHILKTIVFCSIMIYSGLVFGQPGDETVSVGIDISSVDTSSLKVTAYQARYDTLFERVINKINYRESSFKNKKFWTYSQENNVATISFQWPINTIILTSDTSKMEIFFGNGKPARYANLVKYPIIFQPGVFVCNGNPATKKSFVHVKDSTLDQVVEAYYNKRETKIPLSKPKRETNITNTKTSKSSYPICSEYLIDSLYTGTCQIYDEINEYVNGKIVRTLRFESDKLETKRIEWIWPQEGKWKHISKSWDENGKKSVVKFSRKGFVVVNANNLFKRKKYTAQEWHNSKLYH